MIKIVKLHFCAASGNLVQVGHDQVGRFFVAGFFSQLFLFRFQLNQVISAPGFLLIQAGKNLIFFFQQVMYPAELGLEFIGSVQGIIESGIDII